VLDIGVKISKVQLHASQKNSILMGVHVCEEEGGATEEQQNSTKKIIVLDKNLLVDKNQGQC
jgi:hypothetical protein